MSTESRSQVNTTDSAGHRMPQFAVWSCYCTETGILSAAVLIRLHLTLILICHLKMWANLTVD